jgi:hypothetical protein
MSRFVICMLLTGLTLAIAGPAGADELSDRSNVRDDLDPSWSYQPLTTYQPNPRAIIHQKAMARAEQRATRLASLSWYGMSNLRPTASATPFTSLYSPAWQTPGGRPFAWYSNGRPTYLFR